VEMYYRYLCERPFVGESYDRSSVTNDIRRVIFWTVQSVHWIFQEWSWNVAACLRWVRNDPD